MPDDLPNFDPTRHASAPRFRYSLADLAIVWVVLSLYFAACAQFGPLGFSTATAIFGLGLLVLGVAKKRKTAGRIGAFLFILSVSTTPFTLLMYQLRDLGPQPVTDEGEWPQNLRHMIKVAGADETSVKMSIHGTFLHRVHCCRMDVSPDQVDAIVADFSLQRSSEKSVRADFWRDFPRDVQPVPIKGGLFFINPGPVGKKDDNYILMYDPQMHWLYVWNWFNF